MKSNEVFTDFPEFIIGICGLKYSFTVIYFTNLLTQLNEYYVVLKILADA